VRGDKGPSRNSPRSCWVKGELRVSPCRLPAVTRVRRGSVRGWLAACAKKSGTAERFSVSCERRFFLYYGAYVSAWRSERGEGAWQYTILRRLNSSGKSGGKRSSSTGST